MFEDFINSGGISVFYAISQIFALVAFLCDLVAIQQKKKSSLLNFDTLAAFCSVLHYAFLGAWAGMASKIITTIRNAIAAREAALKHRSPKLLPFVFVVLYTIIGIFTFESIFSVLPILAPSLYAIVIYMCDVKKVRYAAVATNIMWLIYNIFVFSIVGIIVQVVLIVNGLIAIYRYRKKAKRKSTK
ncbi:YgjV family protein [Candidatus Saccharibacteria bacterium]|nr:YgjV family protein [Candidatus Saccharibacteria bacterium]